MRQKNSFILNHVFFPTGFENPNFVEKITSIKPFALIQPLKAIFVQKSGRFIPISVFSFVSDVSLSKVI